MDGCQALSISSVRCHFLIYSHLLLSFFPHTSAVYLLMNSVSQAQAPALPQGEGFFFFLFFFKDEDSVGALIGTLA